MIQNEIRRNDEWLARIKVMVESATVSDARSPGSSSHHSPAFSILTEKISTKARQHWTSISELPSLGFLGTLTPTLSPHVNRGWRSRSRSESSIMTSRGPPSSRPASQSSWDVEVERLRVSHDVFTSGQPMLWTTYAPSAPCGAENDTNVGNAAVNFGSGQPALRPLRGNISTRRHTFNDLGPRRQASGTTTTDVSEAPRPQFSSTDDVCVATRHDLSINNAGKTPLTSKPSSPTP